MRKVKWDHMINTITSRRIANGLRNFNIIGGHFLDQLVKPEVGYLRDILLEMRCFEFIPEECEQQIEGSMS